MEVSLLPPRIDFYTASDGRRLAARVWPADDTARARVVFLHGITSHGGWYEQITRHLMGAGFDVHFLDRRGSGLNAQRAGDVEDWRTWIDDVAAYLSTNASLTAGDNDVVDAPNERVPTVLSGISWG